MYILFIVLLIISPNRLVLVDAQNKEPIADAYGITSSGKLLISNSDGVIEVNKEIQHLQISHINYHTLHILAPFPDTVFMQAQTYTGKDILVIGKKQENAQIHQYQDFTINQPVERQLRQIEGLQLVQRGAFAWEPMVRGLSDQRLSVSIDGMRVYAACTDKMDPPTAYIETGNLEQITIQKESNSGLESGNGFAGLHLKLQEARFQHQSLQLSSGFRAPDSYRFFSMTGNSGWQTQAIRYSVSFKQADDFSASDNQVIKNSGFSKLNASINHRWLDKSFTVSNTFIYDDAWEMGFPVLLMDATRAKALMLRQEWQFLRPNTLWANHSLMGYYNSVRHKMDDYSRDVANRDVMRNMYMPMEGTTETFGLTWKAHSLFHSKLNLNMELIQSTANGFMLMEPLDTTISPMYLDNLSDVVTQEAKFGFNYEFSLLNGWLATPNVSLLVNHIFTDDERYAQYFEELYQKNTNTNVRLAFQAQITLAKQVGSFGYVSFNTSVNERNPNHNERYSHYIYNYVDGFFYEGNPWLKNEFSVAQEVSWQLNKDSYSLNLSGFYRSFNNYISGVFDANLSSEYYSFMRYSNVGKATLLGFELRVLSNLTHSISMDNRISYTKGRLIGLNDNLPYIAPLSGYSKINWNTFIGKFTPVIEWSAAQNNIADKTSIEDTSNEWMLVHVSWEQSFYNDNLLINAEIQNVFDTFVVRHVSMGNLPEHGRSFGISIKYLLN
ncbi:TonB-dependent receptor [bacterium]|nr:MAG: TonB-dependent receptor [bacterium]